MKESNQYLPVLGEKGIIPINIDPINIAPSYAPNGSIGEAAVFSMESILSKTYFALSALMDEKRRVPSKDKYKHTPPKEWINHVESSKVDVFRKQKEGYCAPYYVDGEEEYQLDDGVATAEKSYSGLNTIKNIMKLCIEEIKKVLKIEPNFKLLSELKEKMETMLRFWIITSVVIRQIEEVKSCCKQCAEVELENAKIEKVLEDGRGDRSNANSMREAYMLKAIRDASQSGFLLAGIGNLHAKHLKLILESEAIKTILLEEFMTTAYTRDAFDSSHSSIPDSTTRP